MSSSTICIPNFLSYNVTKTDEDPTSWLLRTFGEREMMAQLMARRLLVFLLIKKDFRVCHSLLARGNFVSVNLNHQKCASADILYMSAE
jgi:hypothetical protein